MSRQQTTNREHGQDTARSNILTNGGFEIWQRGPGPVTYAYHADRWELYNLTGTAGVTFEADSTNQDTGQVCCLVKLTGSGTAVQRQAVENWRDFRGKTVSLTLRIKAPAAAGFNASLSDGVNSTGTGGNTVVGAYQTLTIIHAVAANATQLWLMVNYVIAGNYYLDSAMLVLGAVPTDYQPLHPADDLARCLRYYEIVGGGTTLIFSGYASAGGQTFYYSTPYMALKPTMPTVTKLGSWTGVGNNVSTITNDSTSYRMCRWAVASAGAGPFYVNPQTIGFAVEVGSP